MPADPMTDALLSAPTEFRVIAVQSYGHGGSIFLHSLIDGHPQVLALPGALGVQFYASWSIRIGFMPKETIGHESMKALIMDFFSMVWNPADGYALGLTELGEKMDQLAAVDREAFSRAFDILFARMSAEAGLPAADKIDHTNIHAYRTICLKAVYLAYSYLLGHDLSKKKFLLYPAHGGPMLDIGALCSDFPDIHFVHMVREPVENLDSIQRRLLEMEHETPSQPPIDIVWCVFNQAFCDWAPQAPVCGVPMYAIHPYPTAQPGRTVGIQLEQLHSEPQETLGKLCRWLGLDWDDCLMQSTFAGKTWWNRPGWRRVTGFNRNMTTRPPKFGKFDYWRLKWIAVPIDIGLGYSGHRRDPVREWTALALSLALPFGLEFSTFLLRRYLAQTGGNKALALLITPPMFAWDFVRHRSALVKGFFFNRAATTRYVPMLAAIADKEMS